MRLATLTVKDRPLFERFLKLKKHELCVYAFENMYIWRGLFDIRWAIIEKSLCVFFEDRLGRFLYLEPLGIDFSTRVLRKVFQVLDRGNIHKGASRIENVEADSVDFYARAGYTCSVKAHEYLYARTDLALLRGNSFKSKRSAFNYCLKQYAPEYLPFSSRDKEACLRLYAQWSKERKRTQGDGVYRGLLDDSLSAFTQALGAFATLKLVGRVVKVRNAIRGFTFGYAMNRETFCILYEVADLRIKGLAQFIFRKFCQELTQFRYINCMDDSGLANLKRTKLSYRPERLIPAYNATRTHA